MGKAPIEPLASIKEEKTQDNKVTSPNNRTLCREVHYYSRDINSSASTYMIKVKMQWGDLCPLNARNIKPNSSIPPKTKTKVIVEARLYPSHYQIRGSNGKVNKDGTIELYLMTTLRYWLNLPSFMSQSIHCDLNLLPSL